MQDCYVGDIGDFGKYGLLRWLCQEDEHGDALSLGVLWYHFECCDGGHRIGYLDEPHRPLRECCPDLFDRLCEIVQRDRRSIAAIEASGALPPDTVFFSDKMIFGNLPVGEARQARRDWSEAGTQAIKESDLVFVDPNTGIETPSNNRSHRSAKHVYYDELATCWSHDQSLVIYQHSARTWHGESATFEQQIEGRMAELHSKFAGSPWVFALRFKERAYFVVPQPDQADLINKRARSFVAPDSPWREHFKLYICAPS